MECSVAVNRKIRKLGCPITAHSTASETMQTKNDVLVVEVPARVGADSPTVLGSVEGSHRRSNADGFAAARHRCCHLAAWKYAVAESVEQAKHLVVPKAGIKSDFGDDIGRGVETVDPQAVEGFAVARLAQQEIVSV